MHQIKFSVRYEICFPHSIILVQILYVLIFYSLLPRLFVTLYSTSQTVKQLHKINCTVKKEFLKQVPSTSTYPVKAPCNFADKFSGNYESSNTNCEPDSVKHRAITGSRTGTSETYARVSAAPFHLRHRKQKTPSCSPVLSLRRSPRFLDFCESQYFLATGTFALQSRTIRFSGRIDDRARSFINIYSHLNPSGPSTSVPRLFFLLFFLLRTF